MEGLHLTADCFDCEAGKDFFINQQSLRDTLTAITLEAGMTIVGEKFHPFIHNDGSPAGITGALLLAESHVAIHTWPERAAVTLDVYVCNFNQDNGTKARQIVDALIALFRPASVARQELQRGLPVASLHVTGLSFEALSSNSFAATRIDKVLASQSSRFQQIEIAETADFGKIMRIDGAMMTSEKDEFFYHECLVHPAAITHAAPRMALIIGGGDGGSCEELLKHPSMESIILCEIDAEVVNMARQHLQNVHKGALDDSKIQHRHEDGFAFVRNSQEQFDLILLDLTDPVSPGAHTGSSLAASCMTVDFFQACAQRLEEDGMLVLHLGSPFYHPQRFSDTLKKLQAVFPQLAPYTVYIPLYGSVWGMAIASMKTQPQAIPASTVNQRIKHRGLPLLKYYNGEVHQALFALPNYVKDLVPQP